MSEIIYISLLVIIKLPNHGRTDLMGIFIEKHSFTRAKICFPKSQLTGNEIFCFRPTKILFVLNKKTIPQYKKVTEEEHFSLLFARRKMQTY